MHRISVHIILIKVPLPLCLSGILGILSAVWDMAMLLGYLAGWYVRWEFRDVQINTKIFYCHQHCAAAAAAAAKSLQSCPTLCDPTDSSPPGSPVPGILQARTLEWVAISFSSA